MLANACGPCIGQWNRFDENSSTFKLHHVQWSCRLKIRLRKSLIPGCHRFPFVVFCGKTLYFHSPLSTPPRCTCIYMYRYHEMLCIATPPYLLVDACPSRLITQHFVMFVISVYNYTFLIEKRNCERKVSCPRTQHSDSCWHF